MIARVWHGYTLPSSEARHAEYLQNELLRTYRGLSGSGAESKLSCRILEALATSRLGSAVGRGAGAARC